MNIRSTIHSQFEGEIATLLVAFRCEGILVKEID